MEITGSIGIIAHPAKPEAAKFAARLMKWLKGNLHRSCQIIPRMKDIKAGDGLLIALGGDGFFMRVAEDLVRKNITTPLLGANLGNVGFLTLADEGNVRKVVAAALNGQLEIEKRHALRVTVNGETFVAVNDMYVRPRTGMLVAAVDVTLKNKAPLYKQVRADTLIFYTPMGSAAYNDSAGGSIIMPTVPCFGMTALAAQARRARAKFIFDAGAKVALTILGVRPPTVKGKRMRKPEPLPLQVDGDICIDGLADGTVIEIECFESSVRYLGDGWQAFAKALHEKAEVSE